jgi:hypothetical protein
MDVPAEKIERFFPFHPGAQGGTSGVLAFGVFIQFCVARGKMHDEVKFFQAREWREGRGNFGFGIFSGSFEWSDVAIAQAGPIRSMELPRLAMKIPEAVLLAKGFRLLVRFVISGQDKKAFAERLKYWGAAFQPLAEIAEVARSDVNVRGLRDDALESAQIAVNVAEDQNFHRTFPV